MFVKKRSWNEPRERWVDGKTHWMAKPWLTACGAAIGEYWLLNVVHSQNYLNGCKKCGIGPKEPR